MNSSATPFLFSRNPRSSLLISGSKKVIKVWNLRTSTCTNSIDAHDSWVDCVCVLSPTRVASASDSTIKIFDIVKNKCLMTLKQHTDDINSLISISRKHLCSSSDDQTIKLWDLTKGECLKSWNCNAGGVKCLLHLPTLLEGKDIIACGADDGSVKLWDLEDNEKPFCVLEGHNSTVWCIIQKNVENGTGQILSASDDHSIRLWDLKTKKCIKWLQEHEGAVFSLSLLCGRDGSQKKTTYFASGSADQTIKIWDLKRGVCLHTITKGHSKNINTLLLVGRNQLASASNDKTIKIWNIHFNDPNSIDTTEPTTSSPVSESGQKRGLIAISCGRVLKGHTHGIFALSLFANDEKEKIQKEKLKNQFERLTFLKNNQEKKLNDSFYIQFGSLPQEIENSSVDDGSDRDKKNMKVYGSELDRPVSLIRIFKSLLIQSNLDLSGKECVIFRNIRYPLDVDEFYIWCMLFGMMDVEESGIYSENLSGDSSPFHPKALPLKRRGGGGRNRSSRQNIDGLDPICYFDLFVFFQTLNMKNYMYIICRILQRELSVSKMTEFSNDSLDDSESGSREHEKWGNKRERFRVLFLLFLKSLKLFERKKKMVITEEYLHDHLHTPLPTDALSLEKKQIIFDSDVVAHQTDVDEEDEEVERLSSQKKYEKQLVQLFEGNVDVDDDEEIFDCKFKSVFTLNLFNILKTHYDEIVQNRRYVYFLDHFDYLAKLQFFEVTPIETHPDFKDCDFSTLRKKSYSRRRSRTSLKKEILGEKKKSEEEGENSAKEGEGEEEEEEEKKNETDLPFTLKDLFEMNLRKLYETKKYANLCLITKKDGKKFRLHKEVLVYKSNFFYRMFKFPGRESQSIMNFGKARARARANEGKDRGGKGENVGTIRVRDDDEAKGSEDQEDGGEVAESENEPSNSEPKPTVVEQPREIIELPEVEIEFLKSNELHYLIQFIYLGEITSNDLGVSFRLLEHAEMYFEKELKEYLINKINHIFYKAHTQDKFEAELTNYGYYVSNLPEKLQEQFFETWVMNFKTSREVIGNMIRNSEKTHEEVSSLQSEKEILKVSNESLKSSLQLEREKSEELQKKLMEYERLLQRSKMLQK